MNAAELFVKALEDEGVEYVFGIPGDKNLHFMEALRKRGTIRFILTRHEQAAGFMAAAYGRLTGNRARGLSRRSRRAPGTGPSRAARRQILAM